jgi:hypothetical protein
MLRAGEFRGGLLFGGVMLWEWRAVTHYRLRMEFACRLTIRARR